MKILYINSCVRKNSRTNKLAKYLLAKLNGNIEEINLNFEKIKPFDDKMLEQRDFLIKKQDFKNEAFKYATQFANADIIVISAPYWDLSFPAILKTYIEHINVLGITFKYSEEGYPISLCKAQKLIYITTSGGTIIDDNLGFGYIKKISELFYGIKKIDYIKAENLDIIGADVEDILNNAQKNINKIIKTTNFTAGIDNDTIWLMPVDTQLYTAKTGSFDLKLDKTIITKSNSPVVHYNKTKLLNEYHTENTFTKLSLKNDAVSQKSIWNKLFGSKKQNELASRRTSLRFDISDDNQLQSNVDIINISRKGCLIKNNEKLKLGDIKQVNLKFDDIDINLDTKVSKIEGETVGLTFINMPDEVANKLIYRYIKKANAN